MDDGEKLIVIELLEFMANDLVSMANCVRMVKATLEDQMKLNGQNMAN